LGVGVRNSTGVEVLRHKQLIGVATILLEGLLFEPIFQEAQTLIEPPRRLVVAHHRQLDQFDPGACKLDDGLDQSPPHSSPPGAGPNVHADEQGLMSPFRPSRINNPAMPMISECRNAPNAAEPPSRSEKKVKGRASSASKVLPNASGLQRSPSSRMSRYKAASAGVKRRT
jgi:hypothetical protein